MKLLYEGSPDLSGVSSVEKVSGVMYRLRSGGMKRRKTLEIREEAASYLLRSLQVVLGEGEERVQLSYPFPKLTRQLP